MSGPERLIEIEKIRRLVVIDDDDDPILLGDDLDDKPLIGCHGRLLIHPQ